MARVSGAGSAGTSLVELSEIPRDRTPNSSGKGLFDKTGRRLGSINIPDEPQGEDRNESLPSPTTATQTVQRWNQSKVNVARTFAAFWSFVIMGANDAAYGVSTFSTLI